MTCMYRPLLTGIYEKVVIARRRIANIARVRLSVLEKKANVWDYIGSSNRLRFGKMVP